MVATCQNFIGKTFLHLTAGLSVAAASSQFPFTERLAAALGIDAGITVLFSVLYGILLFFLVSVLMMMSPGPWKYAMAFFYAFMMGQMLRPLVERLEDKNLLLRVFGLTAGIFAGMTVVGFYDNQNILGLTPYLVAGLLGLIIAQLILMIVLVTKAVQPTKATDAQTVLSFLGVGLFGLFAARDTQVMKKNARSCTGIPDYVNESFGFFLDLLNLFQNVGALQR